MLAEGITSCNSSRRFGPTSAFKVATPVTLPPGRFRVGTIPAATGSAPVAKMMGIVVVLAFAASAVFFAEILRWLVPPSLVEIPQVDPPAFDKFLDGGRT